MNRFQLIILLICLAVLQTRGQSLKKGDRYFHKAAYYSAAQIYRQLLQKGTYPDSTAVICYKLGQSLLKMNRIPEASEYLQKAIQQKYCPFLCLQAYATVCQLQGNYTEALEYLQKSQQLSTNAASLQPQINSCHYALAPHPINEQVHIAPITAINSQESEFGVCYYKNGSLLYSSTRITDSTDTHSIAHRTGTGFSRVYLARKTEHGFENGRELKYAKSTYGNDGGLAYSPKDDKLYCTRFEINGSGYFIYRATINFNKIFESTGFSLGKDIQNFGHPAFTEDGKRLYFTSTMKGGYGQADIWYIEQMSPNKWSKPYNAGPEVNTPGNEVFPQIHGEKLYFSSDYHPGFGGLDLFVCQIKEDKHIGRTHLLSPFNSCADDFNIAFENDSCGVFVSNRNYAQSDDIFEFKGKILSEPNFVLTTPDTITNPNPAPLVLEPIDSLKHKTQDSTVQPIVPQTFLLPNIYYEFGKATLVKSSKQNLKPLIELLKQYPELNISIASHTDSRGDSRYNLFLSKKRAQVVADYLQQQGIAPERITYKGYGETQLLISHPRTEHEHQLNRRTVCTLSAKETADHSIRICEDTPPAKVCLMSTGYHLVSACEFNKEKRKKIYALYSKSEKAEIIENLEQGGWKIYFGPFDSSAAAHHAATTYPVAGAHVVKLENKK